MFNSYITCQTYSPIHLRVLDFFRIEENMITQESFDMYMESLREFIDFKSGSKYIKVGYVTISNGVSFLREGDKTVSIAYTALKPNIKVPPMTITDTYVYIGDYMFQYDTVHDKVSYFAQGTIDDLRFTKIEDFDVIRKFFTAVTGYEFK